MLRVARAAAAIVPRLLVRPFSATVTPLARKKTASASGAAGTQAGSAVDTGSASADLETAIRKVEEACGKGAVRRMGQDDTAHVDVISSGSLSLDLALGIGGLPRGRVVEIYGPESSGKTTLALSAIAAAQRAGGACTIVDAEHALDVRYAQALGVKVDQLYVAQPDSGEQALEIVDSLVSSRVMSVIVVDSVAALVPRAELEGEMGDHHIGLQARLMSQALRKLTATLSGSNTLLIFINQLRHKVGVMFGNPEVTSGGLSLKFYASVRLEIRKTGLIKSGNDVIGHSARVKVVKNKLAPPFREAEFDIDFGKGISRAGELVDLAAAASIIQKTGSWYSFGDRQLAQGRENCKKLLEESPALAGEIEAALRKQSAARGTVAQAGADAGGAPAPAPAPAPAE